MLLRRKIKTKEEKELILIVQLREGAGQIWKQHLSRLLEQKGMQTEEVGIWKHLKKSEKEVGG